MGKTRTSPTNPNHINQPLHIPHQLFKGLIPSFQSLALLALGLGVCPFIRAAKLLCMPSIHSQNALVEMVDHGGFFHRARSERMRALLREK